MNQHALRPQLVIYKEVQIFTDIDILSAGLSYAGFDAKRQGRVNLTRNMKRYKQFFGVDPSTAAPLFRDLRDNFPSFRYKDGLMTLNWLWLNDKQSVLSGRWGCCEEYIGPTVKTYAKMIQSLKKKKIKFVFTHGKRHIASIDCSNFTTNEFRQDSSGRWYDHKSNSSGLVSLGLIFFSCLFLSCSSQSFSVSKRNTNAALISGREELYGSEDLSNQQHMTFQFFVEGKRK